MKLQILHDGLGRIVGLGRVEPAPRGRKLKTAASLQAGRGQSLLEVEVTGDLAKRPLAEIYEGARVDPKAKKLVARAGGRP